MYNNPAVTTATGTSALAVTGLFDVGWMVVGAITLIFAGAAFMKVFPKKAEAEED